MPNLSKNLFNRKLPHEHRRSKSKMSQYNRETQKVKNVLVQPLLDGSFQLPDGPYAVYAVNSILNSELLLSFVIFCYLL